MPIIEDEKPQEPNKIPSAVKIAAPAYRGVTVDTRYQPVSSLMTHVEGSSWTINYYSQLLNDDSPLVGQSITRSPVYQQYTLIKRMELKVTSPLTTTQDESKQMVITGAATVYPFLIPNVGDMFLADIGDGNEGLFQVKSSERKTIFADTCHVIEYQLIDNVSLGNVRRDDLRSKTVNTLIYIRNFLEHGQNPLVFEEEFVIIKELHASFHELTDYYFKQFTSNEYKTLLLPGQQLPTYDPFLTKAVISYFTTFDTPEIRYVKKLNVDGDPAMDVMTLWDAIAKRDKRLLTAGMRKFGLVFARSFTLNPMLEGIFHTGVVYVIYPKDTHIESGYQTFYYPKQLLDVWLTDNRSHIKDLKDLIPVQDIGSVDGKVIPLINPIVGNDYYIFSKAFYETTEGQSRLELCVQDYLNKRAVDVRVLRTLVEACQSWDGIEQFYFIPILLALIKTSIRAY